MKRTASASMALLAGWSGSIKLLEDGLAHSGTYTATATSVISDEGGSAYLTSDDGKVVECRFSTGFTGGQGRCEGMNGRKFLLVIGG